MEEVLEKARELYPGLKLKPASARMWTKRGLIPSPAVESLGGTQGTRAHYPTDTPAQMAVAAYMSELGYKQREIARAREWILDGIPLAKPIDIDHADWRSPEMLDAVELPEELSGPKASTVAMSRSIRLNPGNGPGGRNLLKPPLAIKSVTVKPFRDRLEYVVSIPGFTLTHGMGAGLFSGFEDGLRQHYEEN